MTEGEGIRSSPISGDDINGCPLRTQITETNQMERKHKGILKSIILNKSVVVVAYKERAIFDYIINFLKKVIYFCEKTGF